MVGVDDLVQILRPQGEGHLLGGVGGGVVGQTLAVHQVELGDDLADASNLCQTRSFLENMPSILIS